MKTAAIRLPYLPGLLTGLLVLAASCADLPAPAPERRPAPPRVWDVPPSTLVLPFRVPLAAVKAWTEAKVPAHVQGKGSGQRTLSAWFLKHDWHYSWTYDLTRAPLALAFDGPKIRVSSGLTGTLAAQWDTLPGDISSDVEADAGVEARLSVAADWKLKSTSQVFLDVRRAEVPIGISWDGNFFGETISIAGPVQDALRPSLDQLGHDIDARLGEVDLRPPVEAAWRDLQEPRPLAGSDRLWFTLGPRSVALGPLTAAADAVQVDLALTAQPSLTLGDRPDPVRLPLPPAGTLPAALPRMVLNLPVGIEWGQAAREALARLPAGGWVAVGNGAKMQVHGLEAATDGDRVQVKVAAKVSPPWPGPAVEAVLWLSGKPQWNPAARTFQVTGLTLDVKTRDLLTQAASWLLADAWVKDLEKLLVWDLGPELDRLRDQATASLKDVSLNPHLTLTVAVDRVDVVDFATTDRGASVLARLEGTGSVTWVP
jgi:hypothetical protein